MLSDEIAHEDARSKGPQVVMGRPGVEDRVEGLLEDGRHPAHLVHVGNALQPDVTCRGGPAAEDGHAHQPQGVRSKVVQRKDQHRREEDQVKGGVDPPGGHVALQKEKEEEDDDDVLSTF